MGGSQARLEKLRCQPLPRDHWLMEGVPSEFVVVGRASVGGHTFARWAASLFSLDLEFPLVCAPRSKSGDFYWLILGFYSP